MLQSAVGDAKMKLVCAFVQLVGLCLWVWFDCYTRATENRNTPASSPRVVYRL